MPDAKSIETPGKRTLWTYRILGLVVALCIATIPYLIPSETAIDPLWQRFLLAGIITVISIGNIFLPFLQRHTYYFVYAYLFLVNIWLIELAYLNNFSLDYAPTVFVLIVASSLVYKHFKLLLLNLALLFIFSGCLYYVPTDPLVDPFFFMMIELSFMVGIGILMDRQINERASLRQDADRQRVITLAAFDSSDDGLLVTDMDGETLQVNEQFLALWGLEKHDLGRETPIPWTEKVLQFVASDQHGSGPSLGLAGHETAQFSEILRLKDGRVIELFVRPLTYADEQLGRIWVFKNISKAEEEKGVLAQQRNVLAVENRALAELAANTGAYGEDLNKMLVDIGRSSLEVLQATRVCIWLADEVQGGAMQCQLRVGETAPLREETFPIEPAAHAKFFAALRENRVWVIDDAASVMDTDSLRGVEAELCDWTSLFVPLRYAGELIGFIALQDSAVQREWTPGEISFASSLGDIGGIVLEAAGRKAAEHKLEEKLALLKSVFEVSEIGIMVSSPRNEIMDFNASFLQIWGISPDDLYPGNERAVLKQMKARLQRREDGEAAYHFLLENPEESRFDLYEFTDGRIIERTTRMMMIGERTVGRTWFYRDITQRKRDEEALKISERQNRAIVDAVPDLMLRMDHSGNILQIKRTQTKEFQALSVHTPKHLRDLFPAELITQILDLTKEVVATGQPGEIEYQLEFAGKRRDIEIRLGKSEDHDVLALIRDVTQRKTAERELIQRNFELDSFVYRSSHDLKAPLNSLMGLLNIMQEEEIPAHLQQYIKLMDRSVVKLDTFIRNLNEFARVTRQEIVPEKIDFEEMLAEIGEGLAFMEHADRVEQHLQVKESSPMFADRFHLNIVMSNLMSNAIKYQDFEKDKPSLHVNITVSPSRAVLEVRDNGIGIPKVHQDKLFQLFFRASNQSFGSGLGLYITKNAIEKIDGSIEIESEEGEGTTFRIYIPNKAKELP